MHPDAESDTRSPWFEAFAPHAHPPVAPVHLMVTAADEVQENPARPEPVEPDWSAQAIFDCYNG